METHNSYISLRTAKILKRLGFHWECHACYQNEELREFTISHDSHQTLVMDYNKVVDYMDLLSAPTLAVAQRWLREVKDIDVYIFPTTNNKRGCVYEWGIKTFGRALWVEGQPYTNQYETYEEAQEAGIKKTLEMILEKGE